MELRHLRYFVAVAEELNFTRAAQRLNTAQPSLSQQIQDLEQQVGVALLIRTKRSVKLTVAGTAFLDEARLTLAQARRAIASARQAAQAGESTLVLGFGPAAEIKLFPSTLTSLRASFPKLRLEFRSMTTLQQREALLRNEIDLAFLRPPIHEPRLEAIPVLREQLLAVLPAGHPLAGEGPLDFAQLSGYPFIEVSPVHSGNLFDLVRAAAHERGVKLNTVHQVVDVLTGLTLVSLGEGYTLLPDYAESLEFRNVTTRRLTPPAIEADLLMAWRKGDPSSENAALRDLIISRQRR
ncbi:MAG TPA: LysR substrate-binding domain-containing protein [Acidobacteriaceae bacterium]|nr:LysR substrate-binding domain-containing protein [Acidobacteriaceae bacterium]